MAKPAFDIGKFLSMVAYDLPRVMSGQQPTAFSALSGLAPTGIAMPVAPAAPSAPATGTTGTQGALRYGGSPSDHAARSGQGSTPSWQSDLAYDLRGTGGQPIYAPMNGTVVRVLPFHADPQTGGTNLTIQFPGGQRAFFQHMRMPPGGLRVGQRITRGQELGTLWAGVNGGAHLHLGATSRSFLDSLLPYYGVRPR